MEGAATEYLKFSDPRRRLEMGLAWTAHELAAPLRSVKSAIDYLVSQPSLGPEHRPMLVESRNELENAVSNVLFLLDWAVGSKPLRLEPVDLIDLVQEAAQSCVIQPSESIVRISGARSLPLKAEASALRIAIANVIRNAVAHSPAGSPVRVIVGGGDELARVRVIDDGPGVPLSLAESIFDPLVTRPLQNGNRGTGLGLFIARRIVESHGGSIRVERRRRGASFRIEVPRAVRIEVPRAVHKETLWTS